MTRNVRGRRTLLLMRLTRHTPRLGLALAALATPGLLMLPRAGAATEPRPAPTPSAGERVWPQTSERTHGPIAAARTSGVRRRTVVSPVTSREVARGVTYRTWQQVDDPARGSATVHLLEVDPAQGARLDLLAGPGTVPTRRPVTRMVADDRGAVAGVNGDFFDIVDTGAPLGNSRDIQRGLQGARVGGWNNTFWIDQQGRPWIGTPKLVASMPQFPRIPIAHLNSPTVNPGNIGVYTPLWGRTLGARVTDGRTTHVREVVVRDGIVRANRRWLSRDLPITGQVLIGRGVGADRLKQLAVGRRVTVTSGLSANARLAVSGNVRLLLDRELTVTDDAELHPRTAVGIDRDTGKLLLVVVDGRSKTSIGATLVSLATTMRDLGAEAALNLDGGGSSAMVARRTDGTVAVLNTPSDGEQRPVPNGLAVFGG